MTSKKSPQHRRKHLKSCQPGIDMVGCKCWCHKKHRPSKDNDDKAIEGVDINLPEAEALSLRVSELRKKHRREDREVKIFKYVLEVAEFQSVNMPVGAVIRHIGSQGDNICIWAEVDDSRIDPEQKRVFVVVGTGHNIPSQAKWYRGTVQMRGFVWHIYEH